MNRDEEWNQIRGNINDNLELECNYTINIRNGFLSKMSDIINKIKYHPYLDNQTEENRKDIIRLLDKIGYMFYTFPHRINELYKKHNISEIESSFYVCHYGLPTSHNFTKYLPKLTLEFFKKYYLLQINCIEEFIRKNGELPTYLYGLTEEGDVLKYKYFSFKDITDKRLKEKFAIPNYLVVKENDELDEENIYNETFISYYWKG